MPWRRLGRAGRRGRWVLHCGSAMAAAGEGRGEPLATGDRRSPWGVSESAHLAVPPPAPPSAAPHAPPPSAEAMETDDPEGSGNGSGSETQSEAGQEQVEGGGDGSGGDAPRRRRFKTCSARKPDKRNPHTSGALFAFTACGAMFPAIEAVGCKTTALVSGADGR